MAWSAAVGLLTSGCSFALSGPKRARARDRAPACSEGKGAVVVDGLVAVAASVGAFAAFDDDADEAGVVLGLTGLLYTIAAARGNSVVNACRDAKEQFASNDAPQAQAQPQAQPQPQPQPQPTPPPQPQPQPPPPPQAQPQPTPPPPPAREGDWGTFWEATP